MTLSHLFDTPRDRHEWYHPHASRPCIIAASASDITGEFASNAKAWRFYGRPDSDYFLAVNVAAPTHWQDVVSILVNHSGHVFAWAEMSHAEIEEFTTA